MSAAIVWGVRSIDWGWFDDNVNFEGQYLWPTGDDQFLIGVAVAEAAFGPVRLPHGGYPASVSAEGRLKVLALVEDARVSESPDLFLVEVH